MMAQFIGFVASKQRHWIMDFDWNAAVYQPAKPKAAIR